MFNGNSRGKAEVSFSSFLIEAERPNGKDMSHNSDGIEEGGEGQTWTRPDKSTASPDRVGERWLLVGCERGPLCCSQTAGEQRWGALAPLFQFNTEGRLSAFVLNT